MRMVTIDGGKRESPLLTLGAIGNDTIRARNRSSVIKLEHAKHWLGLV
jgi:hypothetical protein